jgi:LacI family transcriptional regulator
MRLIDIAKMAGVSHSTASRVINGNQHVSKSAAKRVWEAIEKSGYKPRKKRDLPVSGKVPDLRFGSVGVLVSGMNENVVHTPMIEDVINGIENALSSLNLSMVLARINESNDLPVFLSKGNVDGVLLVGWKTPSQEILSSLKRHPCVWLSSPTHDFDSVQPDNRAVGVLAANYLVDKGCRDLAFLDSSPYHPEFNERKDGFISTAFKLGVKVEVLIDEEEKPPVVADLDQHELSIERLVAKFLELSPRPTGMFIPADLQTAVVYRILKRKGIKIGDELNIISCDNWEAVLIGLEPRPVTVCLHPHAVGELAVNHLFWKIAHNNFYRPIKVLVAPSLVEGKKQI